MTALKNKAIKSIIILLTIAGMICTLPLLAIAHNSDIFSGNPGYSNVKGISLGISPSALNSVLTLTLYNTASSSSYGGWGSSITPNAYVSSVINLGTTPSAARDVTVIGAALGTTLGRTVPYDIMGNILDANASFWSRVEIQMNNDTNVWGTSVTDSVKTTRARKSYYHETGHALKLAHPAMGSTSTAISGHTTYGTSTHGTGWYPVALMNQGFPDGVVSSGLNTHDLANVTAKWG